MSTANDYGGQDKRHEIVQNTIPAMVLAILAVAARFAARRIQRGGVEWHDWFVVLALIGSLLQSALVIDSATRGIGLHIQFVSADNLRNIFILEYISKIDYALTFTFVKISILLLYRAIFAGRGFAIATNIIMGYVIAWGIAVVLVSIFSCNPVRGFWDVDIPSTCVSSILFFEWTTLTNVLGDVMILVLPVRKVWQLHMNKRRKTAVSGMFLLGGFVVLATVIRLVYMMKMDVTDATWTYVDPAIWFTIELNTAVISACLPTLRPLVQRLWPTALATSISSYLSKHTYSRSRGTRTSKNKSTENSEKARKASKDSEATVAVLSNSATSPTSPTSSNETDISKSLPSPTTTYIQPTSPTLTAASYSNTTQNRPSRPPSTTSTFLSRFLPHRPSTAKSTLASAHSHSHSHSHTLSQTQTQASTSASDDHEPFTPISHASLPNDGLPPASIPMPAPMPLCYQPEDLDRKFQPQTQQQQERRNKVRSWMISEGGITETGRLSVDFGVGKFGGTESRIDEVEEDRDSERGARWGEDDYRIEDEDEGGDRNGKDWPLYDVRRTMEGGRRRDLPDAKGGWV